MKGQNFFVFLDLLQSLYNHVQGLFENVNTRPP